jgi:hypothetical protein
MEYDHDKSAEEVRKYQQYLKWPKEKQELKEHYDYMYELYKRHHPSIPPPLVVQTVEQYFDDTRSGKLLQTNVHPISVKLLAEFSTIYINIFGRNQSHEPAAAEKQQQEQEQQKEKQPNLLPPPLPLHGMCVGRHGVCWMNVDNRRFGENSVFIRLSIDPQKYDVRENDYCLLEERNAYLKRTCLPASIATIDEDSTPSLVHRFDSVNRCYTNRELNERLNFAKCTNFEKLFASLQYLVLIEYPSLDADTFPGHTSTLFSTRYPILFAARNNTELHVITFTRGLEKTRKQLFTVYGYESELDLIEVETGWKHLPFKNVRYWWHDPFEQLDSRRENNKNNTPQNQSATNISAEAAAAAAAAPSSWDDWDDWDEQEEWGANWEEEKEETTNEEEEEIRQRR